MNRAFFSLVCGIVVTGGVLAQTADDPNEGFRVSQDDPLCPNEYTVSWYGRLGRTYFLQHSEDLITWNYFPGILEPGSNAAVTPYCFSMPGTGRFFFRLIYPDPDIPTNNPYEADLDGDKIMDLDELSFGTDPLHKADSDGDGIPDDWETRYGLDPHGPNDAAGNLDGDSLTNLEEYQNDLSGTIGSDPTDYYNGHYPAIVALSGDGQTNQAGTFSQEPLVIELKYGNTPVNGGPVTVSIDHSSFARISATPSDNGLATTLPLTTDANGRVSVYFKCSTPRPDGDASLNITARIGSQVEGGAYGASIFSASTQDVDPYPPGTVGRNATDAIDTRIAASTAALVNPETAKLVFSVQDHTPLPPAQPTYIRNTSSWCYDLRQKMTCISPYNSWTGTARAGTAITAQHIVTAQHARLRNGDIVRFITANAGAGNPEVVETRTIVGTTNHPIGDVTVHTLSSPLPPTITPCWVLPANYGAHLSYLGGGRPPVMYLDKEEKALVKELRGLDFLARFAWPVFHSDRLPFYEHAINDDSGNPAFLIINNSLVLVSMTSHSGTGDCSFVNVVNPTLNEMIVAADANASVYTMTTVNTGLQVQTVELSGFIPFTPP